MSNVRLIDPAKLTKARGLRPRSDVADKVGVSQQYISMLEKGERAPSDSVLYELCKLYGVKVTDLLSENFLHAA